MHAQHSTSGVSGCYGGKHAGENRMLDLSLPSVGPWDVVVCNVPWVAAPCAGVVMLAAAHGGYLSIVLQYHSKNQARTQSIHRWISRVVIRGEFFSLRRSGWGTCFCS